MSATPDSFNKNFGLTEPEFSSLQEALRRGDEQLFERIFLVHFERCMSFLKSKYGAGQAQAYDTVMGSLLQFRQLLVDGKVVYNNLEAYFLRIVETRYLKDQKAGKEIPTEHLPEPVGSTGDEAVDEETLAMLAKAWSRMSELCQKLLKGFYYDSTDLKTMTVLLGDSSEANTRKRKERCIKELRKYFFELEGDI